MSSINLIPIRKMPFHLLDNATARELSQKRFPWLLKAFIVSLFYFFDFLIHPKLYLFYYIHIPLLPISAIINITNMNTGGFDDEKRKKR